MAETPQKPTRDERLAAKLRENLHRRKAQARALDNGTDTSAPAESNAGLSKKPPSS